MIISFLIVCQIVFTTSKVYDLNYEGGYSKYNNHTLSYDQGQFTLYHDEIKGLEGSYVQWEFLKGDLEKFSENGFFEDFKNFGDFIEIGDKINFKFPFSTLLIKEKSEGSKLLCGVFDYEEYTHDLILRIRSKSDAYDVMKMSFSFDFGYKADEMINVLKKICLESTQVRAIGK